jgi:hypothetical protein
MESGTGRACQSNRPRVPTGALWKYRVRRAPDGAHRAPLTQASQDAPRWFDSCLATPGSTRTSHQAYFTQAWVRYACSALSIGHVVEVVSLL